MKYTHKGLVRWFDKTSGEGMVCCEETGLSYYLHFTSVKDVNKNNYGYPAADEKNMPCEGNTVRFTLYGKQVDKLKITNRTKPRKRPSFFKNRKVMKRKLLAADAMFSELYPKNKKILNRWFKLQIKSKLTKKEIKELEELEIQREEHYKTVRKINSEKTAFKNAIYTKHTRCAELTS